MAACKSFFLCPSCGQKRTLLLGEYLADDLLLRLPHRQFVWTIPKALRGFLKRDRSLFAAVGKLIFALIAEYYSEAAGRPVVTGMVSSHQTFGEYATWHPHWHTMYIVRAPVGLEKLTWDQREDTISWKVAEKGHWRGEVRHFDSLDSVARRKAGTTIHSSRYTTRRVVLHRPSHPPHNACFAR